MRRWSRLVARDPSDLELRPVLSRAFWVMMALAVVCMATAAVVAVYGPRLFPAHAPALGVAAKAR